MTIYDIVRKISKIRMQCGFSARALSQLIDKDNAYIYKLENLKINPTLATLYEIITVCDSSFEELFYFENYDEDREILEFFHACSSQTKDRVLRFIRRCLAGE